MARYRTMSILLIGLTGGVLCWRYFGEAPSPNPTAGHPAQLASGPHAQLVPADLTNLPTPPVGPVVFPDDPYDTYYSYFESRGQIPPTPQASQGGGRPDIRKSEQMTIDGHMAARRIRYAAKRLGKRDFLLREMNPDEQVLCAKLYHWAVNRFDPKRVSEAIPSLPDATPIRMYQTQSGLEMIQIQNGTHTAHMSAVLF